MDRNKDGVVTIEEFIESCKKVQQRGGIEKEQISILGNMPTSICILAKS